MFETNPRISIGMPVYNGAAYIRGALDSLLAQTFVDFELIISDNASTDETQLICEQYALRDTRVRYVRQSENKGALANFKYVLDQAQGEFFMWAAADDQWSANWIELILSQIQNKHYTAGFGQLLHIDENGKDLIHPANGARLQFTGSRLSRLLGFYLAYEGRGKANLFYAIYPVQVLRQIDLCGYQQDYQILFDLIDKIEYTQVENATLHKRIHAGCEGVVSTVPQRLTVSTPFRILLRDVEIAKHYLPQDNLLLRLLLTALMPVKIFLGLIFHAQRGLTLLRNKWRAL